MSNLFRCKIPAGTLVGQDFSFWRWPGQYAGRVNDWFTAKDCGGTFILTASGFGEKGAYGNGAIHISKDHLIVMEIEKRSGVDRRTGVPND